MSVELAIVIGTTFYKLGCLSVGALSCVLGYRLFKVGIWGSSGDVTAKFSKTSLVVKNAAPGTFFAVVGALIAGFTVYKGISFDLEGGPGSGQSTSDASHESFGRSSERWSGQSATSFLSTQANSFLLTVVDRASDARTSNRSGCLVARIRASGQGGPESLDEAKAVDASLEFAISRLEGIAKQELAAGRKIDLIQLDRTLTNLRRLRAGLVKDEL